MSCPVHIPRPTLRVAAPHLPSLLEVDKSPLEDKQPMSIRKDASTTISLAYLVLYYHRHPPGGRENPHLPLGTSIG